MPKVREAIKLIEADGWREVTTKGSTCVATGATREQTERRMYEAIQMHVDGLIEDKLPVPASTSFAEYVVVPA